MFSMNNEFCFVLGWFMNLLHDFLIYFLIVECFNMVCKIVVKFLHNVLLLNNYV